MKKKKIVLIVEDDEAFRIALTKELSLAGFDVISSTNGKEGLDLALKEHPDLTWLDLVLPKEDGISFIRDLRKDEWGKTAKIILLTQINLNEKIAEAMDLGVFDYLIKADHSLTDILDITKKRLDSDSNLV